MNVMNEDDVALLEADKLVFAAQRVIDVYLDRWTRTGALRELQDAIDDYLHARADLPVRHV